MVELLVPNQMTRVRFPSPAPSHLRFHSRTHSGLFHLASASRNALTREGRNLRLGYTAKTGICVDVQRGNRRTRSPRARGCLQ